LRDRAEQFREAGCVILGASFDTPEENRAFAADQGFGFRLLSDVDRSVGDAYGVARSVDDQYATFPRRVSFLIDPEGIVQRRYTVADVSSHAEEVLADLEALQR
jgi:thioredoxin-dependent peroxiredoxin